MKLLDLEISHYTYQNVVNLFWHGNYNENDLAILGIQEGFEKDLFQRNDIPGVKPISLSEKGYVMARAHFFIERASLLEMERSLFEVKQKIENEDKI